MKKLFVLMVSLIVFGEQCVMAQKAKIILHHQGSPSFFASDQLQKALDASVEGDTVYLSAGKFSGDVTISKKIVIIGAGADTSDSYSNVGNITISIGNGEEALTATLLEGLKCGNITVASTIRGLSISKCSISTFSGKMEDATINQCIVNSIKLSNGIKGLLVNNSKLARVSGSVSEAQDAQFTNCNLDDIFGQYESDKVLATFRNCIINNLYGDWGDIGRAYYDSRTVCVNCLAGQNFISRFECYNCWTNGSWIVNGDSYECNLTEEQMISKGYIGTDGTVVGIYGGDRPYSLQTISPKIKNFTSAVDPETHKVTINLTVTDK